LRKIIAHYNVLIAIEAGKIGMPPADVAKWQLRFSPSLESIMAGSGPEPGEWTPYIQVDNDVWTDTQVNYEIDLEYLYVHAPEWRDMWKNIWMSDNRAVSRYSMLLPQLTWTLTCSSRSRECTLVNISIHQTDILSCKIDFHV